jgi:hypothetical protein
MPHRAFGRLGLCRFKGCRNGDKKQPQPGKNSSKAALYLRQPAIDRAKYRAAFAGVASSG